MTMKVRTLVAGMLLTGACGCEQITIMPSCPTSVAVGEFAEVHANQQNPGAIASYFWEVFPATAGVFANPLSPDTTFQGLEEGPAVIRLSASDGLFQVVDDCTVSVSGTVQLAVSISATPITVQAGDEVILACISVGETDATELTVERIGGPDVELIAIEQGIFTFDAPEETGAIEFRCIGEDAAGSQSQPSLVTVTVVEPPADNVNENVNDNAANGNDNADNDNANDNAANRNDNADNDNGDSANGNDNIIVNGNDNS